MISSNRRACFSFIINLLWWHIYEISFQICFHFKNISPCIVSLYTFFILQWYFLFFRIFFCKLFSYSCCTCFYVITNKLILQWHFMRIHCTIFLLFLLLVLICLTLNKAGKVPQSIIVSKNFALNASKFLIIP